LSSRPDSNSNNPRNQAPCRGAFRARTEGQPKVLAQQHQKTDGEQEPQLYRRRKKAANNHDDRKQIKQNRRRRLRVIPGETQAAQQADKSHVDGRMYNNRVVKILLIRITGESEFAVMRQHVGGVVHGKLVHVPITVSEETQQHHQQRYEAGEDDHRGLGPAVRRGRLNLKRNIGPDRYFPKRCQGAVHLKMHWATRYLGRNVSPDRANLNCQRKA
jgi:hypothetical protein